MGGMRLIPTSFAFSDGRCFFMYAHSFLRHRGQPCLTLLLVHHITAPVRRDGMAAIVLRTLFPCFPTSWLVYKYETRRFNSDG